MKNELTAVYIQGLFDIVIISGYVRGSAIIYSNNGTYASPENCSWNMQFTGKLQAVFPSKNIDDSSLLNIIKLGGESVMG